MNQDTDRLWVNNFLYYTLHFLMSQSDGFYYSAPALRFILWSGPLYLPGGYITNAKQLA